MARAWSMVAVSALALGAGVVPASAQFAIGGGSVAELYAQNCASCHGVDLAGGGSSSLIDDEWLLGSDDASIFQAIAVGWPDGGMPGYADTMSDEEIRALVVFIREARYAADQAEATPPAADPDGVYSTDRHNFQVDTVYAHEGTLWSVEFLPDGRMLASDKLGDLVLVDEAGETQVVSGTPEVWPNGQGGLLDIGVHPDFADNGWIYLSFSAVGETEDAGMTKIVRGRIADGAWMDEETIFEAPEATHMPTRHHFGTRLVFDDGYLFFAIGDRGRQDNAQDLTLPNGKMHRIHDDGRVPDDNPFADVEGAFPTLWTYGNRNPQGVVLHPNGGLYATEHGPRGGDELNRIEPGNNYGWPAVTYGLNYNGTPITALTEMEGVTNPLWHWTPSIAACGLAVAQGEAFPDWAGDLFAGGLTTQLVERIRLGENDEIVEREVILQGQGRVRDVVSGPGGDLYVVVNDGRRDDTTSRVLRLSPADGQDDVEG